MLTSAHHAQGELSLSLYCSLSLSFSEEGPLRSSEDGLRADAAEGEHGQAAILELLEPHLVCLLLILGEEVLTEEEVPGVTLDVALPALEKEPPAVDLVDA